MSKYRKSKIIQTWQILDNNGQPFTNEGRRNKNCYKKVST